VGDGQSFNLGGWESKFSISALDIQASALIGYSPSKVQKASSSIVEAYKFYLVTNPQVKLAISSRPAAKSATKTRWLGFKVVVHEIMNESYSSTRNTDPLFDAKALLRAGYPLASGAMAGVVLEAHLKKLCILQGSPMSDKSISSCNTFLRSRNVYDLTQSQRIDVLAGIRNRCDHYVSNPPSDAEIKELMEGTQTFIKNFPA
jgi:hypothetical protein